MEEKCITAGALRFFISPYGVRVENRFGFGSAWDKAASYPVEDFMRLTGDLVAALAALPVRSGKEVG